MTQAQICFVWFVCLVFFIIQESGHPKKENEEMKSTQLGFIFNPPLFGTVL